jgi:tetratricopeptide (TPR) repeat protein
VYFIFCVNHFLIRGKENNGSVLRDCSKALTLNLKSSKAFYRSALALVALERAEEALDCCDRCLAFDPENKGIQAVRLRAQQMKSDSEKKEKDRQEKLQRAKEAKYKLNLAFRVRDCSDCRKSVNLITGAKSHSDSEQGRLAKSLRTALGPGRSNG